MPADEFDLISHWRFEAPIEAVWAALVRPEDWPQWWPYVRSVAVLRTGDAQGIGALRRMHWSTRLPYRLSIEVESVAAQRHRLLHGRSRGQLEGEGIWTLHDEVGRTRVTYRWRVKLSQPWMRRLAPWLAAVFRWNHDAVMRAGEIGLARYLAQQGASAGSDPVIGSGRLA
jgi:uncharacterized protein YndB with AHSA1/START domain